MLAVHGGDVRKKRSRCRRARKKKWKKGREKIAVFTCNARTAPLPSLIFVKVVVEVGVLCFPLKLTLLQSLFLGQLGEALLHASVHRPKYIRNGPHRRPLDRKEAEALEAHEA